METQSFWLFILVFKEKAECLTICYPKTKNIDLLFYVTIKCFFYSFPVYFIKRNSYLFFRAFRNYYFQFEKHFILVFQKAVQARKLGEI